MIQKDLKGMVILFVFSAITAFSYNFISPFGIALVGQWESSKGTVTAISKKDSVDNSLEINNPELVRQIIRNKERIVLDVRPREIYDQGHLPSALSYPLMDFDEIIGRILGSLKRESAILVYCSSVECTDSHTFAERLKKLRYNNIKVFSGGYRQWQEKGFEIEKNEE